MLQQNEVKFCQSCIERGFNPIPPATREWQTGIYYCDECFNAVLENLTMITPAEIEQHITEIKNLPIQKGPVLDFIYELYQVPKELQFDRIDIVQRNYDKIFNFHAPAIINRTIESLQEEIEQLGSSLFYIKFRMEPLEMQVKKLKEERRKEKGLQGYQDSKEEYAKTTTKTSKVKSSQEEKMAKTLGMSVEAYREMTAKALELEKKNRERKFNILAGNCPACGGVYPCVTHPNERLV